MSAGCGGYSPDPDRRSQPAAGFSVLELTVALLLTLVILALIGKTLVTVRGGLEKVTKRAEATESARIARTLAQRVIDWDGLVDDSVGQDEVRVRFPVGWAERCNSAFRWFGIRLPDPDRDSAFLVDSLSRLHTVGIEGITARTCDDGGSGLTFTMSPSVAGVVLVRVWEPGLVRIDDAVRYGRPGSPRQPLTAAILDPSRSHAEVRSRTLTVQVAVDSTPPWLRSWLRR